jgi:hypothetical protein
MAVVRCFVSQTEAATADEYRSALAARLSALSDVYNQAERAQAKLLREQNAALKSNLIS